jgi:ribosome-associated protein
MSDSNPQPDSASSIEMDEVLRFAVDAARIADDNRTEEITVLDLRGISSLADYFVLGTGTSDRQMHAVLYHLKQYAKTVERAPFRVADSQSSRWILADYVDVVVHLFDAEHREYYDLDGLWGDAPRIAWRDLLPESPDRADDT